MCANVELVGSTIQVASREEILDKIGRSPDYGSALCLALMDTPKRSLVASMNKSHAEENYDPYQRKAYDPYGQQ